mmetsp:Transcript_6981/g.7892  ORF Transcript_6981/g.7892 Transcript_6981/m.7892 type:complete len:158 (-) Transcript_6981:63-536(-)
MVFDLIFSKIIFRLRHFWVGLLLSLVFLGIQTLGRYMIPKKDFPNDVEELKEVYWIALAVLGYVFCHFFLWLLCRVKSSLIKDPSRLRKDKRIENVIKKYDKYLREKESYQRLSQSNARHSLMQSKDIDLGENFQTIFMKQVLYNYLDKELKQKRQE